MSNTNTTKMQRLQTVLDGHGANISRWPQEDHDLLAFIKENPTAGQLFDEVGALDQLLDLSVPEPADTVDLQRRIMADFADLHGSGKGGVVAFANDKRSVVPERFINAGWMSAGALAACFAFGLYLGGIGIGDWTLDPADSIASLSRGEGRSAELAEFVMSSLYEEEQL